VALEHDCVLLTEQIAVTAARATVPQRKQALQQQLSAAVASGTDFKLVGSLGEQLDLHSTHAQQLTLSEDEQFALTDKHAALVQRLQAKCKELTASKFYALVWRLGARLEALRALDLSSLPQPWDNDPVYVSPEEADALAKSMEDTKVAYFPPTPPVG
jgi:hypothetical protein